jgi:hypothetical protein
LNRAAAKNELFRATVDNCARRETVYFLARLIHEHCVRVGTRRGTRALSPFRHAVLVLRWFLDGTRVRQLAADSDIGKSTCHDRLHEAIDLLAALAPDVHEAILAAKAAGAARLNLDGTLIYTDRVAMKGPNGADLWWSGKHKHHVRHEAARVERLHREEGRVSMTTSMTAV